MTSIQESKPKPVSAMDPAMIPKVTAISPSTAGAEGRPMELGAWIQRWPVVRQLTQDDALGRGAAVKS